MEKIAQEIAALKERYIKALSEKPGGKAVSREEFTLLLSGISTCRKVPGIPVHMGYESLYHCESEEDARQVREHLERLFHITDKDSLYKAGAQIYHGSDEYEQFMTFWSGAPLFDVSELHPDGQKGFLHCKQLAEVFHPIVREKGFYAWDIDNIIGLCRSAVACGILSDEEFWAATDTWVRKAQVFYHSYEEYAISSLCGAVYDMGRYDDNVSGFFDINRNLVENLLGEGGAWQRNAWYVPKEREWAVLLDGNMGCMGCFVTKRALNEGNYTRNARGARAKVKANVVQGIRELVEIASEKTFHKNHKAKHNSNAGNGWYYYTTRFALPIYDNDVKTDLYNIYSGCLVVNCTSGGKMYLYDLVDIKKEASNPLKAHK